MPYTCAKPEGVLFKVHGSGKYKGECAALVQSVCKPAMPLTSDWRAGLKVKNALPGQIARGTAIATFVDGRYPQGAHNKHAALYLSHDETGIQVIDQWKNRAANSRTIRWGGNGRSNDGDYFYVIEGP